MKDVLFKVVRFASGFGLGWTSMDMIRRGSISFHEGLVLALSSILVGGFSVALWHEDEKE